MDEKLPLPTQQEIQKETNGKLPLPTLLQNIKEEKERLGDLEVIEITADTMTQAHRLLGQEVSAQAKQHLTRHLDEYRNYEEFAKRMTLMTKIYRQMLLKTHDPSISSDIKFGLQEYLDCMVAQSQGIGTQTLQHPLLDQYLSEHPGEEDFLYHTLLQLENQNDNVGCQSGMVRHDEQTLLWHTEEDYEEEKGERTDKPRLVKFNIGGQIKYSFIYPDLMPGPAFSFGPNFFYNVDSTYTKANRKPSILANTAMWMAWFLAEKIPPQEVVHSLKPFLDGYILNYVWRPNSQSQFEAGKIEFAHALSATYPLDGNQPIISTNKLEPLSTVLDAEKMDQEETELFQERARRAKRSLHLINLTQDGSGSLENIRRMTGFTSTKLQGEAGMSVDFTKAHAVAQAGPDGLVVWVGAGPTTKKEKFKVFDFRSPPLA